MRDLVVVETIPGYLRALHVAAGNSGTWPHNGAERIVMDRADAEELVEHDSGWSEILQGEDPKDYTDDEQARAILKEQKLFDHINESYAQRLKKIAVCNIEALNETGKQRLRDPNEARWWLQHFGLCYPDLAPRAVYNAMLAELEKR
jgi:hypothetical protein